MRTIPILTRRTLATLGAMVPGVVQGGLQGGPMVDLSHVCGTYSQAAASAAQAAANASSAAIGATTIADAQAAVSSAQTAATAAANAAENAAVASAAADQQVQQDTREQNGEGA